MSSAHKVDGERALCLHISGISVSFAHRAKPANEENQRFSEWRTAEDKKEKYRCACT